MCYVDKNNYLGMNNTKSITYRKIVDFLYGKKKIQIKYKFVVSILEVIC